MLHEVGAVKKAGLRTLFRAHSLLMHCPLARNALFCVSIPGIAVYALTLPLWEKLAELEEKELLGYWGEEYKRFMEKRGPFSAQVKQNRSLKSQKERKPLNSPGLSIWGKMKRDYTLYLFAAIGSFLIVYIALPLIVIFAKQSTDWGMLIKTLRDAYVIEALKNSLLTATATALIALFFGVPLGYVLARKEFPGKSLVQAIVDVPIVIPHSVVGIMLLVTFSSAILDNYTGIIAAMLFVSASFSINAARDGFLAVDEKLENVARTLGASRLKAFFSISLPMAFPSIASGAIMTWARAISEVGAILIVAYYPKTAQVLVMEYFNNYGLRASRPISVILIAISLTIFVLLRWLVGRTSHASR